MADQNEEELYRWLELVRSGSEDDVARELARGGLPRDASGDTLRMAAAWTRPVIIRLLLDAGVDVDSQDKAGSTPLHVVVGSSSGRSQQAVATLELLLRRGAQVDLQDRRGVTALAWAAWNGNDLCVPVLLRHGASPNIADEERKTPLIHATERRLRGLCDMFDNSPPPAKRFDAIRRALLAAGADPELRDAMGKTAEDYREDDLPAREPPVFEVDTLGGPADETPASRRVRPIFAIVGARPVKLVGTADGGMDVQAFDWQSGEFVRELDYLSRILGGDPEVDIVSSRAFDQAVARLRAELARNGHDPR